MNFLFFKNILLPIFFILSCSNFGYAQSEKTTQDSTWFKTSNHTKLIYWPTAFGLKKGEYYYQNLYLFWQQFNIGITDNFSLGIGLEVFNINNGDPPIFSISPKYTEPLPINDKLHVGVGAWTLSSYDFDSVEGLGVIYGLVSYGVEDFNVTIGLGHGNYGGRWSGIPQVNFGFNTRLGKRVGVSGEFWLLEIDQNKAFHFYSMSLKFIGKKITADIGLVKGLNSDFDFLIPLGSVVIPFGKGRKKRT